MERAERFLASVGVSAVEYLIVPDFHGVAPIDRLSAFQDWCRRPRPFAVQWALHGYYHEELLHDRPSSAVAWLKRHVLTSGEGEFLGLTGERLHARLTAGIAAFTAVLGTHPDAFVAPAWLFNRGVPPALVAAGIRYTEDHLRVYDLVHGVSRPCPVISWSARTAFRRLVSQAVCGELQRRWRNEPAIRIALHPFDFDFPVVVAHIGRVIETALKTRTCARYAELFQDDGEG